MGNAATIRAGPTNDNDDLQTAEIVPDAKAELAKDEILPKSVPTATELIATMASPRFHATSDADLYAWLIATPPANTPLCKTLERCFLGSLPGSVVVSSVGSILGKKYGMNGPNTIYGQSLCPDEINNEKNDLATLMAEYWGECFPMGGIGGAPFVGKTGFKAFSSHVPDGGNVIIAFGPHVGISEAGELGKYLRIGQCKHSGACGAVLAAYAALKQANGNLVGSPFDKTDMQQSWLVTALSERWSSIEASSEPLAELTKQAYMCVKEKLLKIVNTDFGSGRLVLLGGIQVNMPAPYEDHFQPLFFKVLQAGQEDEDLLNDMSFTPDPSVRRGSREMSREVLAWLTWSPSPSSPLGSTLYTCFPGALPSLALTKRTATILMKYGIGPKNSIFGHSFCPDEINHDRGGVAHAMKEYFGSCFPMGGIGGAPFVGKTGFSAFSTHVPEGGHVVILFGPHIGISEAGELGKYHRYGQASHSTACGAVFAAYADLCKRCTAAGAEEEYEQTDMQQSWIRESLSGSVAQIQNAENPYHELMIQAYKQVQGKVKAIVNHNFGTGHLVLLGGIQINLPDPCQDHFQPMLFELIPKGQPPLDLLQALDLNPE
mmetsp:Transcript_26541/g.74106  ORF Transcript_26541/g.74106 Transcript_26541/m.74106 type:complete len:603 (-) Transcript_26541:247-2055(-)